MIYLLGLAMCRKLRHFWYNLRTAIRVDVRVEAKKTIRLFLVAIPGTQDACMEPPWTGIMYAAFPR